MHCNRREALTAGAGLLAGSLAVGQQPAAPPKTNMGVVIHSYGLRQSAEKEKAFADPLKFLDYCRSIGAGGVQTGIGVRTDAEAAKIRERIVKWLKEEAGAVLRG